MKQLFLDVETTGLWPNVCAITQIGYIYKDTSLGTTDKWNVKMRPHQDAKIEDKALEVTGETPETLATYKDPKEVADEFVRRINAMANPYDKKDKVFFIGYNVRFDEDFIRAFLKRHTQHRTKPVWFGSYFWTPSLCVMNLAAYALTAERKTLPNFKLTTVYKHMFDKDLADAHDAFADIEATIAIHNKICKIDA